MSTSKKSSSEFGGRSLVAMLENQIREGHLRRGDRLPSEHRLCEDFGVSRTIVREALQTLKGRGIVVSRRGSGNYVGDINGENLHDLLGLYSALMADDADAFDELFDFRMLIECECAARAAQHRSAEQLAEIKGFLDIMSEKDQNIFKVSDADEAFHLAIARAAGNKFVSGILHALLPRLGSRFPRRTYSDEAAIKRNITCHREIYRAIEASNSTAARTAMRKHLALSREGVMRAFSIDSTASRQ